MEEVEKKDQNIEILKFLKGRRNLIELNSTWTKVGIDISEFKTNEDKLLILLCLIMLWLLEAHYPPLYGVYRG